MKKFNLTVAEMISIFNAQKNLRGARFLTDKDLPGRILEAIDGNDFGIMPVWDNGLAIIPNIWDDEDEVWRSGEMIQVVFPKGWTIPGEHILPPKAGFVIFKDDEEDGF